MKLKVQGPAKAMIFLSMSDVAFIVLIFIILMSLAQTERAPIDNLPLINTKLKQQPQEEETLLIIENNSTLFCNDAKYNTVQELIKEGIALCPPSYPVTLYAKKDTPYSLLAPILVYLEDNDFAVINCIGNFSEAE